MIKEGSFVRIAGSDGKVGKLISINDNGVVGIRFSYENGSPYYRASMIQNLEEVEEDGKVQKETCCD